jgi:hypothetical protein
VVHFTPLCDLVVFYLLGQFIELGHPFEHGHFLIVGIKTNTHRLVWQLDF